MVKIEPKEISESVDQSNQNIEEFWEKIAEQSKRQAVSCNELILNLCKKSKEMIIIHTPKLTLPELQIQLEKTSSRGVRIYSLTADIKKHQEIFQKGIMREKKEALSTYVLIDPKTNPHGIWCPGELTSTSIPPYALELDKKQIKELWQHFSYEFWNAKGKELFYGKIRKTPEYDGTKPKVNDVLDLAARVPNKMFAGLSIETIEAVYLPENIPSDFQEHILAKKVYTKISERTKELILEIDHNNTDLFGTSFSSIGYLKGNGSKGNIGIVFDGDIAILLDDTQLERVEKNLPEAEWQYRVTKRLSDISGEIVLSTSDWDNLQPDRIKPKGEQRLKDIESKSIEDWSNGLPRPEIPDFGGLYRQVKYIWILHPPYLPKGSKKHRLYDMWASFDKDLSKKVDRLISEMNKAMEEQKKLSIKKTKKITLEAKIREWIAKLDSIKQQECKNKPTSRDAKEAIKHISEIESEFLKEIKGLKPKKKKDGSNELEEILPNSSRKKTEIKIPPKTLPKRGVLFEKRNDIYIAIKDTEDLKYVEPFRKEHRATIVTERY